MKVRMSGTILMVLSAAALVAGASAAEGEPAAGDKPALRATGVGKPPPHMGQSAQARLMARRASEVVALRNLVARAGAGETTGDPRTGHTWTRAFIKGYRVVSRKAHPDGSITTEVELPIENVGGNFKGVVTKSDMTLEHLRRMELTVEAYGKVLDQTAAELAMTQVDLAARDRENQGLRKEIEELRARVAKLRERNRPIESLPK